jgi:hypothetical protein
MSDMNGHNDIRPAEELAAVPVASEIQSAHDQTVTRVFVRRKRRWYEWLRWGDFMLYGVIGACAIALFLMVPRASGQSAAAVLYADNKPIFTLSAAELDVAGQKDLAVNGYHYTFTWEKGRIRFALADCPDKICVRTGWIDQPNEIAACVPGHLILKMIGGPAATDPSAPDVITR